MGNVCEDVIVREQESRSSLDVKAWKAVVSGAMFVLGLRMKATPGLCPQLQQAHHQPGGWYSVSSGSWGQTEVCCHRRVSSSSAGTALYRVGLPSMFDELATGRYLQGAPSPGQLGLLLREHLVAEVVGLDPKIVFLPYSLVTQDQKGCGPCHYQKCSCR